MAVGYRGYLKGTDAGASTQASVNIAAISGTVVNDLGLVVISRSSTGTVLTGGAPSGWTLLQAHSSTYRHEFWAKILDQNDLTTSLLWTYSANIKTLCTAAVYSGCKINTTAKNTFATGSGTTVGSGSITSTNPWLVQLLNEYYASSQILLSTLSGYTERFDGEGSTSSCFWHSMTDTNNTWVSGACNPSFTCSSSTYRGGFNVELVAWTPPTTTGISLYNITGFFGM